MSMHQGLIISGVVSLIALAVGAIYLGSDAEPFALSETVNQSSQQLVDKHGTQTVDPGRQQNDSAKPLGAGPLSRPAEVPGLAPSTDIVPVLNNMLARLERIERQSNGAGEAEGAPPGGPDKMAQEMIESIKRKELRVTQMDGLFLANRGRGQEGGRVAAEREIFAATTNIKGLNVSNVECQENFCRLRSNAKDEMVAGAFLNSMMDKLGSWSVGAESHIVGRLPNGSVELDVFIARPGHVLPPETGI